MSESENWRVRPLSRTEFDRVVGWAADEGWNPGKGDAEVFWASDPEGYVGAEWNGELVGAGSIVSYDGAFGFMGFFIMRPDFRGRGLGARLWHERLRLLRVRLAPGAAVGMDGVFAMQPFYARGGFVFSHRTLRMAGVGVDARSDSSLVELSDFPFERVSAFDRIHFGCDRRRFLRLWIAPLGGLGVGFLRGDCLCGMGVIRPCIEGFKIGPLFADGPEVAEVLFNGLAAHAAGCPVFLDVPEKNAWALALAQRHEMKEVFGCARMYHGAPPPIPWANIYGITTFELG